MSKRHDLLAALADGHFHSESKLTTALELSASELSELTHTLQTDGIPLLTDSRQGYRLDAPADLLDGDYIQAHLDGKARGLLSTLEIHPAIHSTNRHLLELELAPAPASGHVCLAELQSAGRGRRGRAWISPFASQICCSVAWRLEDVSALSLVVGIALAEAVNALGITGTGLKWPNDLLWQGSKLAGILIETASLPGKQHLAVIGLGLNVNLPAAASQAIDQPWTDLTRASGHTLKRNQVATTLLDHLLPTLEAFSRQGFAPFRTAWERHDLLQDCPVALETPRGTEHGIAAGVNQHGALRLKTSAGLRHFVSGEVSLRIAHAPAC